MYTDQTCCYSAHPLELPLDDDLCQVHGQLPLLYGGIRSESQSLDGGDHVLDQVLSHRVVHTVVSTQELTGARRGRDINSLWYVTM